MQANAGYTRAAVRGATCHLRLGDFGAATAMLRASQPHAASPAAAKELADKLQEAERLQAAYSEVTLLLIGLVQSLMFRTPLLHLPATRALPGPSRLPAPAATAAWDCTC